ncbi:DUF4344 domain-containing metallopeptidase [Vibrio maerlii]|uniref:DUF4344 domain-containing metallopeptidase n=1 Tax=Vibrio maerlii TaxID=2231648 RepID=UPI003B8467B4
MGQAVAGISIKMNEPQSPEEQQAKQSIERSGINQALIDLSEQYFPFESDLTIEYGAEDGPLYDPSEQSILIPYAFYLESVDYFAENRDEEESGASAESGAIDTMLHTLLHEVGHAYVVEREIAILGKEEDVVDNFAAIILLNYVENGDDVSISAADMFAFESQSEENSEYYELGEYAGEHSFDLQRYFATLCLVFGSDPDKHKHLLDEVEEDFITDRREHCIDSFETVNNNWHQYLTSAE